MTHLHQVVLRRLQDWYPEAHRKGRRKRRIPVAEAADTSTIPRMTASSVEDRVRASPPRRRPRLLRPARQTQQGSTGAATSWHVPLAQHPYEEWEGSEINEETKAVGSSGLMFCQVDDRKGKQESAARTAEAPQGPWLDRVVTRPDPDLDAGAGYRIKCEGGRMNRAMTNIFVHPGSPDREWDTPVRLSYG